MEYVVVIVLIAVCGLYLYRAFRKAAAKGKCPGCACCHEQCEEQEAQAKPDRSER